MKAERPGRRPTPAGRVAFDVLEQAQADAEELQERTRAETGVLKSVPQADVVQILDAVCDEASGGAPGP